MVLVYTNPSIPTSEKSTKDFSLFMQLFRVRDKGIKVVYNFPIKCQAHSRTLSRYNSVAHVDIIVIWHLSSFSKLSSFRNKKVLKASYKKEEKLGNLHMHKPNVNSINFENKVRQFKSICIRKH